MLDKLDEILKQFAEKHGFEKIFYGGASDRSGNLKKWNYIILKRDRNARSGKSNMDSTLYYQIALVHENYIPEDLPEELVRTISAQIPGLRLAGDILYDYGFKNGTDMVVEAAEMVLCKAQKGCSVWRE